MNSAARIEGQAGGEGARVSGDLTVNDVVLIDGTGAPAAPGTRVVVQDGVVVSVEPAAKDRDGPHVVQGHGRWLLPGLWDAHMHHGFSAGAMTSAQELSAEQLLLNWRAYLHSGVTSVVSTGDDRRASTQAHFVRSTQADMTENGCLPSR